MKRRHLVVLVSAATLLTAVFIAMVTIGIGVGTDTGRDTIRSLIQQQVGGRINGKLHIGRIGGGFLTGFTVDTFAIRGYDDSLLVSTGRIKVDYDLRDLMDRRVLLRNVEIDRLYVRLQQFAKGDWNHERIFRRRGPKGPNAPVRWREVFWLEPGAPAAWNEGASAVVLAGLSTTQRPVSLPLLTWRRMKLIFPQESE